ncbi:MAG: kelch repeat-containing protein, partial [Planctomycetota bacterium]
VNTWSAAGSLATARAYHPATLLPSGKVLVASGWNSSTGAIAGAEQYDAVTNTWSTTGSLATARYYHTATLLVNGKVLVAAGYSGPVFASCEIFDYTGGGSWSAAGSLYNARYYHTATLLPTGRVVVAGGDNGSSNPMEASAELYDPGTNTWSLFASLTTARCSHTATLLPSGKLLITGGWNGGTSCELYDPVTTTWSAAANLANWRVNHTATLLPSGRVLVAGGYYNLSSAEIYDPGTNTWRAAGSLATGRQNHTATLLPSGKVLVSGGQNSNSVLLASAEIYDSATNTWSPAGSLAVARYGHTATLLPSGKVLAAGGMNGAPVATADIYDPVANTWSGAASLATARAYHTATLLPCGKVLVAGGSSAELYDPGTNTWTSAGTLATARECHTATLLPSGKVLVAGGGYPLASAELFDPGLAFQDSWRPVISSATSPLAPGAELVLGGSQFRGISEASGGGYQSSATNYPLVLLESLVNEQSAFLLSDATTNWSDTSFTSGAVNGFPGGYAQATVFTNGIPSMSKIISIPSTGAAASKLAFGQQPATTFAGASITPALTVLVQDALGITVTSNGDLITLAIGTNPSGGTLSGTTTVAAVNGVATFSGLSINNFGNGYTLAASDGTLTGATSNAFNIIGPAAKLAFGQQPANTVVASVIGSYVLVQDANGNTVTTDTSNVTLAIGTNPSGGTLSGTKTVAAASGVAGFSLSIDKAGYGYTLVATDGTLTGATSSAFNITPQTVAVPTFSPAPGTYTSAQSVTISTSTSGATIYYTTDGNLPTALSTKYIGPVNVAATTYFIAYAVSAGMNDSGFIGATYTINSASGAPAITSPLTAAGTVGVAFSYQITASNSPTGFGISGSPAWLNFNGSGALSGTPTATGSWNATISATNAAGTGSATLAITVNPPAPVINSATTAAGTVGVAFTYSITASNNPTSYNASGLPAGLSVNTSTGVITGTPTAAGNSSVALSAVNPGGTGTATLALTIVNPSVATPTFSPAAGTYSNAQSVTIATTTSGATIYYTLDGSTPTTSSTKYIGAINVAATTTIKAYAVSAGLSDSSVASGTYTINTGTPAPAITSPTTATGTAGVAFSYQITASNSPTSYGATGLPAWMSVNGAGVLSGTPTATGNWDVAISATNAGGTGTATLALAINPPPPPVISSATTATGTVGVAFSYSITASNNPTGFNASGLPAGLSVNTSTGVITGNPTAVGNSSVTLSAANASGTGTATLTITISSQAPAISSTLTATGTVGQQFSYTITATGATPMTFSAQPLPGGLGLSGAAISGTPTTAGVTNVTIGASNASGSDSKTLQLTINPAGSPTITSPLTATGQVGTPFSYQIQANGDTPLHFFVDTAKLPAGLSFSGDTISGTPTAIGNTSLSIQAQNSVGTDTETLVITINASGAPEITSALTASSKAGEVFSYTITATGAGTITFGASTLPAWVTLSGATLSGTPMGAAVGTFNVTLTAANASGADSKVLQITITPLISDPPVVTDILRSRNPVRTNVVVTFTAAALSPSGFPLTYSWFFYDPNNVLAGPPQSGLSTTFSFPQEGTYTVVAIAFDGFTKSTNFTKVSITLAPNAGSNVQSLLTGLQAANPVSGLGLTVPGSLGGVLDLDVVDTTATGKSRDGETFMTRCAALNYAYDGLNLASKFSAPSIFVMETTGTKANGDTRMGRLMVPVSNREAGITDSITDQRKSTGLTSFTLKGKFSFGLKPDSVILSCTVELPAGLTVNQTLPVSVGIGNVTGSASVDPKGKLMALKSDGSFIKKLQFKWPRLDKKNPVTKAGDQATLAITLTGSGLDAAGFDTEGIVTTVATGKKGIDRQIQVAIVIAGVSYYAQAKATYVYNKGTGQLTGRAAK